MTYRQACGTRFGLRLHVERQEHPCGLCQHADRMLALEAERAAPPPKPPHTSDQGPTAQYGYLQRQRLLWSLLTLDDESEMSA